MRSLLRAAFASTRVRQHRDLLLLFLLSVACVAVFEATWRSELPYMNDMHEAAETMEQGMQAIAARRILSGIPIDPATDLNRTGLIGDFYSSITTTVGDLEAKRTTTNPNLAGLAVKLLKDAGVKRGDLLAIGASGSFPAVLLAVLSAADTIGAEPLVIVSLGASQWGANLPDFTWLEMSDALIAAAVLPSRTAAVAASIGGAGDTGEDLSSEARALLAARIVEHGVPLLEAADLPSAVALRMRVYAQLAGDRPIAAFVNIGGASVNLGTSPEVLYLNPGLNREVPLPPQEKQGTLHAMAALGVPVIHFLNIGRLTRESGLPWDPTPLPRAGRGLPGVVGASRSILLATASAYLLVLTGWIVWTLRRRQRGAPTKRVPRPVVPLER